ncbi:uncharacterized protein LOC125186791 [Salvia hispanica]|uniref:uncharacterized protein LOC125186791 n=1 Tax=Salvia hispanica TaxID=49212 RepID=UPI002009B447|nr:uncharacterized protein LOC125186791 [Salvia hispanica]
MNTFTPSMVTSNSSILQPKIEANLLAEADLHLGYFQQIESQLLDCMGISDQQPSHSHNIEVSGEDYMHEPGGIIDMPSPGNKNSACLDEIPPKPIEDHIVIGIPIVGRSSLAKNAHDAPSKEQSLDKRLTHADMLHKCLKEKDKIPVLFHNGHPVGKYASLFMKELGIAVKKHAPLQVQGWKKVKDEQKRPIFQQLESAFLVDFSLGPDSVKKDTDRIMGKQYSRYRQRMHIHYKTLTDLPWEDRLKHVPEEFCKSEADWVYMCKLFESQTFKKLSLLNSRKSLSQYTDNRPGEEDGIDDSNVTNTSERCRQGESDEAANNDKQSGSDNQDASNQVPSGHRDSLQPSDAVSLIAANAELRGELHSVRTAIQLMEDKVWSLEANQKRLEEIIKANTQIVETNQLMMQRVFEKLASDIAQSLTSSAAPPPPP